MTPMKVFAAACVRCWTRVYTWRLPDAVRDRRREEIESDLWESSQDPQMADRQFVMQTMMRLAVGMADDLAWRRAQVTAARRAVVGIMTAGAAGCVLLFLTLSAASVALPDVPAAPVYRLRAQLAQPEPPPPPPPPGGVGPRELAFQYGRTSYSVVTDGPPPVAVKQVQPIYPPLAVAHGLEGEVIVRARITEGGRVTDAEVAPAGMLGSAALHAVQQWRFAGRRSERPMLLTVRATFERSQ